MEVSVNLMLFHTESMLASVLQMGIIKISTVIPVLNRTASLLVLERL